MIERIEILPEALEEAEVADPDPEPPRARPSLAALISEPRDLPPTGSSETIEVPSTDPAKWRAYWSAHGRSVDPKLRLRRGQAFSPSISLYELERLLLSPEDRRRLHRELAARTGKTTLFDPHNFVVTQEHRLKQWESHVRASTQAPGSWGRATLHSGGAPRGRAGRATMRRCASSTRFTTIRSGARRNGSPQHIVRLGVRADDVIQLRAPGAVRLSRELIRGLSGGERLHHRHDIRRAARRIAGHVLPVVISK
jgi:hypothetical protein